MREGMFFKALDFEIVLESQMNNATSGIVILPGHYSASFETQRLETIIREEMIVYMWASVISPSVHISVPIFSSGTKRRKREEKREEKRRAGGSEGKGRATEAEI
jgi:hypothetical protein